MVHAPAVPSPLRRKISSRTLLASQLARTSLNSPSRDKVVDEEATAQDKSEEEGGQGDEALLETYRKRVGSVLSQRSSAVVA